MGVEVRARSREVSAKGRRDEETRRRPGRLSGDRGVSKGGGEGCYCYWDRKSLKIVSVEQFSDKKKQKANNSITEQANEEKSA